MRLLRNLLVAAIGCAASACAQSSAGPGGPPAAEGTTPDAPPVAAPVAPSGAVARLDEHRWLGPPVVSVNLTVWPVVTDAPRDLGEFLTLEEAQARGVAKVAEVGAAQAPAQSVPTEGAVGGAGREAAADRTLGVHVVAGQQTAEGGLSFAEGAEVNALVIENRGDLPLLVCAGTIVRGGNQDRQIGEDVVVAARSARKVDVFCVEQGRWESLREGTVTHAQFGASGVVASKSVRAGGQYMKSQQEVWQQVANVPSGDVAIAQAAEVGGRTTYLRNVENATKETAETRARTTGAVRAHFGALRGAGAHVVGFAYAVNGKPVNVRTFAAPRVFDGQFEPFLQAMVIDAEAARAAGPGPTAKAEDVVALVASIRSASASDEARGAYRLSIRRAAAGFNSNCYAVRDAASPLAPAPGEDVPVTEDWTAK